ncbi:MAG: TIGR03086 family metal-binding protein [Actinomycetota bacterium]|jgi:uncharacterized protein (TIGR03086 family)|nr:TIGR03086 family metal-binding protein [Actinomycetota bacterium]
MHAADTLATARNEFERRLRLVGEADWDRTTPCEGWTVRQLVDHVVRGDRIAIRLLDGEAWAEAQGQVADEDLGDDLVAAFTDGADALEATFRVPGALERTCHHIAGEIPGAQLLGFRTGDYALHAWDLARAIGADEDLDPELVEIVWESLQPMAPFIGQTGFFGDGPSGEVDESAPLQVRLLDLTGRRP